MQKMITVFGTSVVLLGKNFPGHFPKFGRRDGYFVAKNPREVRFFVVTQLITDFGHRL
jgi:hypothetical protein